ncbi:MAG: 2-phosphosulfolactate phosphatase [Planctomycetales bacterium]|nr:2-phosphosulfolactate phosphatase [Planctomycetales bacterium]
MFEIAVVIDALRFTTTASQALHAGATQIRTASEVDVARSLAQQVRPALLCGERECRRIDGFDLGNSPWEYTPDAVDGRSLIFSTTNGTRAVAAGQCAAQVALGSFVNRRAIAEWLARRLAANSQRQQAILICAGTDGLVAMEDVLAAGAILDSSTSLEPNGDAASLALTAWLAIRQHSVEQTREQLLKRFESCLGGANLIATGFQRDLQFAADLDSLDTIPASSAQQDVFLRASD